MARGSWFVAEEEEEESNKEEEEGSARETGPRGL